jgi:homoserine O-acetyltransferase
MSNAYGEFQLGDLTLQNGGILPDAEIVYKTYGTINSRQDNVVVYPTWFSGQHTDNEWLIGEGLALNPKEYFVIVPNMFGNGLSTSPSNRPDIVASGYPLVTPFDNVSAQHRLLTEKFGVEEIALVTGYSMGAQQAYHWGMMFPEKVRKLMPFCGSAKTANHNWVFLESVKSVLLMSNGDPFEDETALRAAGQIFASWALSQAFYRERLWSILGFASLEDFVAGFWNRVFMKNNRLDLLAMIATWQSADISRNERHQGDIAAALRSIKAKTVVMPSGTDLYFTVDDNRLEALHIPDAEIVLIDSPWGHAAGAGLFMDDSIFISDTLRRLLVDEF